MGPAVGALVLAMLVTTYLGRSTAMQQIVPATLALNAAYNAPDGSPEVPFLFASTPVAEVSDGILRIADVIVDLPEQDATTAFEIGLMRVQRLLMGWLATKDVVSIELFCTRAPGPSIAEEMHPADVPERIRESVYGSRELPDLRAILYPDD